MLEEVPKERYLDLSAKERRLLANIKTAHDDFVADFVAGHHKKALRGLLNGLDAGALLNALLMGQTTSARRNNRLRYTQFLASETRQNPPFRLLDRAHQKLRDFTFPELLYEIRCQMDHEYEDLDSSNPNVDNHALLTWDLMEYHSRSGWTLPIWQTVNDKVSLNAYGVMEQLSGILAKLIYCIELHQKMHACNEAIDRHRNGEQRLEDIPPELLKIESSHPTFHDVLLKAGIIRQIPMTDVQMRQFLSDLRQ